MSVHTFKPARPGWKPVTAAAVLAWIAGSAMGQSTDPFPARFDVENLLPVNGGDGSEGFVLGGTGVDGAGFSVSSAGDINGDGIDDVIVGAPGTSPYGAAYVVFGSDTDDNGLFPALIDLVMLDGTDGFEMIGVESFGPVGARVAGAGDVNGDGVDDVIVSAYRASPGGVFDSGQSYVVFGKDTAMSGNFSSSIDLALLNGTDGFSIDGAYSGDYSGTSVDGAGDINGDGIEDLIIGASQASPGTTSQAGTTYVVFGGPGIGAGGSLDLSTINGLNGFAINGPDTAASGASVSALGDVNGDSIDDLIIGAPDADVAMQTFAGQAFVVFGKDTAMSGSFPSEIETSALDGTDGFTLSSNEAVALLGTSVASAGDVNADGDNDLIVGAPQADVMGPGETGRAFVLFGGDPVFSSDISVGSINGSNGFALNGVLSGDRCGNSVAPAGDVNGDGWDDLIVGAYDADSGGGSFAGEVYVVFGGVGIGLSGEIDLSSLDGSTGFTIETGASSGELGASVSSAGDVNGDGIDDLLVGDPYAVNFHGECYVIFGRDLGLRAVREFEIGGIATSIAIGELGAGPAFSDRGGVMEAESDLIVTYADLANPQTTPGTVEILFNNGSTPGGTWLGFAQPVPLPVGTDPSGVRVAMLDGDALPDLVVTNRADNTCTWFLNDGMGFTQSPITSSIGVGAGPAGLATGDFDGASGRDAAIVNEADNTVSVLVSGAGTGGGWSGLSLDSTVPVGLGPQSVIVFNADDDKWDDLGVANTAGDSVSFVRNQGFGAFAPQISIPVGNEPCQLISADLDGDGDPDLATANDAGSSVSIVQNTTQMGAVQFAPAFDIPVPGNPVALVAIDTDLDGDLDIVVSTTGGGMQNELMIVRNETLEPGAPLEFEVDGVFPSGSDPRFLAAGGVNSNTGEEVVTSSGSNPTVSVTGRNPVICEGEVDGNGIVQFPDITSVLLNWLTDYPPNVTGAGDANGDGFVDFQDVTAVLMNWLGQCP